MEGFMFKVCRKENKKMKFFLFSDLFLYAHKPVNTKGIKKYEINNQFPLTEMVAVKDIPDQVDKGLLNVLQIITTTKSFNVIIDTPEEKKKWQEEITRSLDFIHQKKIITKDTGDVNVGAAVWTPDSEVKNCQGCATKFTFTNRRHHCRQCGIVVCGGCTTNKKELPKLGKVRVCDKCFKDSSNVSEMSLNNSSGTNTQNFKDSESSDEAMLYELTALYSYVPPIGESGESKKLAFTKGDKITIFQTNQNGWWVGEINGNIGWVPATFLEQPTS